MKTQSSCARTRLLALQWILPAILIAMTHMAMAAPPDLTAGGVPSEIGNSHSGNGKSGVAALAHRTHRLHRL